jgi:hypothetical protein
VKARLHLDQAPLQLGFCTLCCVLAIFSLDDNGFAAKICFICGWEVPMMKRSYLILVIFGLVTVLMATGNIAGVIRDCAGDGLDSVDLSLYENDQLITRGEVNARGEYRLMDIAAGTYLLRLERPGFEQQVTTVTIRNRRNSYVNARLQARALMFKQPPERPIQLKQQWDFSCGSSAAHCPVPVCGSYASPYLPPCGDVDDSWLRLWINESPVKPQADQAREY